MPASLAFIVNRTPKHKLTIKFQPNNKVQCYFGRNFFHAEGSWHCHALAWTIKVALA